MRNYANEPDDNDNQFQADGVKVSDARFCSLFRNESTDYRWALGNHFVVANAETFEAQPVAEQLIMLNFHP